LDEEVELYKDSIPYWQAFSVLSGSRPVGMSVGAILLSEIKCYLELMEIWDLEERLTYLRMIKALDNVYLTDVKDKQKKKKETKKSSAPSRPRRGRR